MKKSISTIPLLLSLVSIAVYGQTGIGTSSPQQQLHVTGPVSTTPIGTTGINLVTPTIRIDGLNKTNNTVAGSSASVVQYVSVTQDGDFILSPEFMLPIVPPTLGTDMIPTPVSVNTVPAPNFGEGTLGTYTFTLKQTAMVHFLASVSATVVSSSGTILTDSVNRIYGAVFKFTQAPAAPAPEAITLGYPFGGDLATYTNEAPPSPGQDGFSGASYVQPEDYLVLSPGTYTVVLVGRVFGGSYNFTCIFGQAADDMVSIIATPL